MEIRELSVPGAWEITPRLHADERGTFLEAFSSPAFAEAVGHRLELAQVSSSVSAAGVVRGVHFADVPPSQAKYVMCPSGAVLDVVVDLRAGSPAFGRWEAVLLDDVDRRALYVSEGLGHAFCSLEDGSTLVYLCSATYAPEREHAVNPLSVGIDWPAAGRHGQPLTPRLSDRDRDAPSLDEALARGLLPTWQGVQDYLATLREQH